MKKITKFVRMAAAALALGAVAVPMVPATAQDDEAVFDPVVESTVRIRIPGTGREASGWVIEPVDAANRAGAAVIITSMSTVEGAGQILVYEATVPTPYEATVLDFDPDRNLVFLEVKDLKAKPIPLSREAPKVGRSVSATGYNFVSDATEQGQAANAALKGGRLSRELRGRITTEGRADVNQLEHDAALLPGFEGGPLVDNCGRIVGINMKSGGEVVPRSAMFIRRQAGLMYALKVDEIIKSANQYGVKPTFKEACGKPEPAPAPVTVQPVPTPTPTPGVFETLTRTPGFLIGLVVLGLAAVGFGIYMLTRKPATPPVAPAAPAPAPAAPSRARSEQPTAAMDDRKGGRTLRLTGRGPGNEPISLSFTSGELQAKPVTIGVGANADAKIPDNRKDYKVSRLHARLGFDGVNFTIEDNKSLNKTYVGGRELTPNIPVPLMPGDTVRLADVEIQVSVD